MENVELADLDGEVRLFLTAGAPGRSGLARDPYPFLEALRTRGPVHRVSADTWLATGHDAADELLRGTGWLRETPGADTFTLAERVFRRSIPFRDPPDHTRLRKAVAPMFGARAMARLEQQVVLRVEELFAEAREREVFDFRDLAYRLPVLVIGDVLGLPPDDVTRFDTWAETLLHLGDVQVGGASAELLATADEAARSAMSYFDEVIAERRRAPGDDVVSYLVRPESGLTPEEVVGSCVILHIGGHATTTDALTNGMFRLLEHPEQYAALRADPGLATSAAEEFLRYDPPVFVSLPRFAERPRTLAGHRIEEGERVHVVFGAVNRDPARFADPARFDLRRPVGHMAFAAGIHFCVGAALARLEMRIALDALARLPELAPAGSLHDVVWADSFLHRGTTALPVRWA
ncbi:cytochrome P450 [Pseudonocardia ailaonensis]|uniref:Cytochrome P450 n=1 Tax=Pseudonocardia ailaonensis TaxID=367279 RepID=A0ABN2NFX6_9PSEU